MKLVAPNIVAAMAGSDYYGNFSVLMMEYYCRALYDRTGNYDIIYIEDLVEWFIGNDRLCPVRDQAFKIALVGGPNGPDVSICVLIHNTDSNL